MRVRKHTVASLGVLSPSCPSLNIGFQSATGAFCASRECECVRGVTHPRSVYAEGGQCGCFRPQIGEDSGGPVSGLGLPIPGCVGVLRIRSEPPELPACFPAVMAASIRGFVVPASERVCLYFSLSLSCSGFSTVPAVAVFHLSLPATPGSSATGIQGAGGEQLALASFHGRRWIVELERP